MTISTSDLSAMERHLHDLIENVAGHLLLMCQEEPELPKLEELLVQAPHKGWMPIDGMYGGFLFWLECDDQDARLVVETSSRICTGFASRFVITPTGCELVAKGIDLS
jgi:hypothetical protein